MRTPNSKTKATLHRSSFVLLAVGAALVFSTPVAAQQIASGPRAEAKVRATVGLTMPVLLHFTPTAQPTATYQGERFTEYVIRYSVASNSRWEVTVRDLPKNVTVLAEDGAWVDGRSGPALVTSGEPTNPVEVLVRVRVGDGSSPSWHSELTIAAHRAGY